MRDPFVAWDAREGRYLLTGTAPGEEVFPLFASRDLKNRECLADAFTPPAGFWVSPVADEQVGLFKGSGELKSAIPPGTELFQE